MNIGRMAGRLNPVVPLNSVPGSSNPSPERGGHKINAIPWINPRVALRKYPEKVGNHLSWEHSVESISSLCNNGVNTKIRDGISQSTIVWTLEIDKEYFKSAQ